MSLEAIDVPENEWTGVHVLLGLTVETLWSPPAADDDLVTWQDNTLVSPESVDVDEAVLVLEELHHSHALESRDSELGWERVDPTGAEEVLLVIAHALETARRAPREDWCVGWHSRVLSLTGATWSRHDEAGETVTVEGDGLEVVLEDLRPSVLGPSWEIDLQTL